MCIGVGEPDGGQRRERPSMATKWATTSTASASEAKVLAQRAIWLRLLPMRATCRVRSRSTSAAGALARREGRRRASPPPVTSARARASLGDRRGGVPRQPLPGTREAWPQRVGWLMTGNGS